MNWTTILTPTQLADHYDAVAALDPRFAAGQRSFYEAQTQEQLSALAHQAWLTNEPTAYVLARSHAAAQEQQPTELTPAGEQFVIPGCERNASPKARQLGLFG